MITEHSPIDNGTAIHPQNPSPVASLSFSASLAPWLDTYKNWQIALNQKFSVENHEFIDTGQRQKDCPSNCEIDAENRCCLPHILQPTRVYTFYCQTNHDKTLKKWLTIANCHYFITQPANNYVLACPRVERRQLIDVECPRADIGQVEWVGIDEPLCGISNLRRVAKTAPAAWPQRRVYVESHNHSACQSQHACLYLFPLFLLQLLLTLYSPIGWIAELQDSAWHSAVFWPQNICPGDKQNISVFSPTWQ